MRPRKFKNLPSGDALKMLLGRFEFRARAADQRAVAAPTFSARRCRDATKQVYDVPGRSRKRVANELILKVKPGTDIDALAKSLGAKVIGRMDKLGVYLLQFGNAAATDAALAQLQNDSDVAQVDYNYSFDPPPSVMLLMNCSRSGRFRLRSIRRAITRQSHRRAD